MRSTVALRFGIRSIGNCAEYVYLQSRFAIYIVRVCCQRLTFLLNVISERAMPKLISLLLPTRGRPLLVRRFFESVIKKTECLDGVEVVLYVDEDDIESHNIDCARLKVRKIIGPRSSMGFYNSRCLAEARGEIIILVNDDMVVQTRGWDKRIRELDESVQDKIYLAYGNDLLKGRALCTFPVLSRRTCEVLSDPYPVIYRGAFIDYHLFDIFKRLAHKGASRIFYLKDVVFEHMHYRAGKAERDSTYAQRKRFADDGDYLSLIETRKHAVERLMCAISYNQYVPEIRQDHTVLSVPTDVRGILVFLTRNILLDSSAPFRWRIFLWFWFIGRCLAARKFF